MNSYRVGIVGLSWITNDPAGPGTHSVLGDAMPGTHLSGMARIPQVQVVAGCDISPEACDLFLERWDSTWPGLLVFDDYNVMLREVPLDIVAIATPDDLHGPVLKAAVDAGVNAIFCEKPISTHTDEVDEMIAAVEAAGIVVNVNHTRRWNPTWVAAREALRSGRIGDLVTITGKIGGERAMLWRNDSHVIDIMNYFAEANPIWVVGELEAAHANYGTRYHGDGGRDASLEPAANAYWAYDSGIRAFLSAMKSAVSILEVELIGSKGIITVGDGQAWLREQTESGVVTSPILPGYSMVGMQAAVVDLIDALENGTEPQSPPHEARKAVAIIEGILGSQASGNNRFDIG
ncbi:MAG: Gfo/Idh/MocA family oxidoreductase [Thermomicrobiales bacterium]|nr:Gfo/Idh/MocA family oxidoreductase [Thermomicrobiales bacterium]MCO5220342.1 Gfo/Idh/MocA family oxidoreductase [Thermomicrobiales bacterium]